MEKYNRSRDQIGRFCTFCCQAIPCNRCSRYVVCNIDMQFETTSFSLDFFLHMLGSSGKYIHNTFIVLSYNGKHLTWKCVIYQFSWCLKASTFTASAQILKLKYMIEKNHLSCRAEGLSAITSAASLNAREAFCSPSAAITCALELFSNKNLNCLFSRQLIVNQYVIEFIEFIT